MKRALLVLAGASFVLSEVIGAVGFLCDVVTRGGSTLFADAALYLKEKAK